MDPKCTEPYYTKPVEPIEKYGHTQCRQTPTQVQVYRALLHQTSMTYGEVQTYPVQTDPHKEALPS